MGIRLVLLDVDKARERPEIVDIAAAIENVECVEGLSIVVNEIDMETVGMEIFTNEVAIAKWGLKNFY